LNPTPNQPPKQPSTDLTPEQIEQNKEAFKKAISEGKSKLKNKKIEKYNEEKSNRYENLENEYKEESKRQIAHENLVLKGYDEVISKLESLTTNKLSKEERKEINDMLKKIDNTNIGAINQVETAIKRLRSKQEKIEEHKTKILDRIKKQEAERKAPRRVSRSSNIMQVSDLAKNDDESDFSIKKKIKTRPHFSGLSKNKT
jgi:Ca2+-binding EF-hand superfamily protein